MSEFLPAGSYRLQARNVRATLYCMTQKRDGSWVPASLDLTYLEETNVANEDGHLVNLAGDAGRKGYRPNGSYLESSKDHHVILSALCPKASQQWQWRTIEITDLTYTTSLSLVDGEFAIDPDSTN